MYTVTMKDGKTFEVDYFDGGGSLVGDSDYEVHGVLVNGDFFCQSQSEIESVVDIHGRVFIHFGNPYYPGHPYETKDDKDMANALKRFAEITKADRDIKRTSSNES